MNKKNTVNGLFGFEACWGQIAGLKVRLDVSLFEIHGKPNEHPLLFAFIVAILVAMIVVLIAAWLIHARQSWGNRLKSIERFFEPEGSDDWQYYWGDTYGPELKKRLLDPVFDTLEAEGKIGNLIVDVGSGASPVTRLLKPKTDRKRICVDVAADNAATADELRIRMDAEKIGDFESLSFGKALARACAFLKINPRAGTNKCQADLIVFSDVLNYVDFRRVLHGFAEYLKPNGRFIVINLPFRGNRLLFSDKGLKNNRHLYSALFEEHFIIEHKSFPKRQPRETDESEELIVLVARKSVR